jgi:hypothetical protein
MARPSSGRKEVCATPTGAGVDMTPFRACVRDCRAPCRCGPSRRLRGASGYAVACGVRRAPRREARLSDRIAPLAGCGTRSASVTGRPDSVGLVRVRAWHTIDATTLRLAPLGRRTRTPGAATMSLN